MRKTIMAAAAAFVIGGIGTGAALSYAQPGPDNERPMMHHQMMGEHPGMMGGRPGMMGWMHRMHHERAFNPQDFALVYRQADRKLTPADVQTIAQAFLLWHGNHTWKVTDVAASPSGPIGFSLSTADGSVVAKFTMNPHTGRIERVG